MTGKVKDGVHKHHSALAMVFDTFAGAVGGDAEPRLRLPDFLRFVHALATYL